MYKVWSIATAFVAAVCYSVSPSLISTASEPSARQAVPTSAAVPAAVSPRNLDIGDCPIKFGPHTVVVGLVPTVVDLGVSDGNYCSLGYEIRLNPFNVDVDDGDNAAVFDPDQLTNRETAPVSVDVRLRDTTGPRRQVIFPYAFHLKRATLWSAVKLPVNTIKGKSFRVSATLVRANWDLGRYEPYANRRVSLRYPTTRSGYSKTRTFSTDSRGRIATTVTGFGSGQWVLSYGGNTTAGPAAIYTEYVQAIY